MHACYLAGKIPDALLPHIRRGYELVKARFGDHLSTFFSAVSDLALDTERGAPAKWDGLKAMTSLHGKGIDADMVLNALFSFCRNDRDGKLAGRMFETIALIRDASGFRTFSQTLAWVRRAQLLPNISTTIRDEITLSLACRLLRQKWKHKHISNFVDALQSAHPSEEGNAVRLRVLDKYSGDSRRPRTLVKQLELIKTAESHFAAAPELLPRAGLLLSDAFRDPGVLALGKLKDAPARELLFRTMEAVANSPVALQYYLTALGVGRKAAPMLAHLERLDALLQTGLGTEYCVLISGKLNEKNLKLAEIFREAYGDSRSPVELYQAIEKFLIRAESRASTRPVCFIEIINRVSGALAPSLSRPETLSKLMLCLRGDGLSAEHSIRTMAELSEAITELASKTDISDMLRVRGESFQDDSRNFARRYKIDNPPFSLETTPHEVQVRFRNQITNVFSRSEDAHFGFGANTYVFRHTPIGRRCLFDEFAIGVNGDLYVIPSADPRRFPGRGRILENIDIDRVFNDAISPETWREVVFPAYGKLEGGIRPGNVHAIDNFMRARITMLRAEDGFGVPSNRFFDICGEPMTLLTSNHHFDASSVQEFVLAPSRSYDSFFDRLRIPYNPFTDAFPDASGGDIADQPPTIRAIDQRAKEMGLDIGVIQITSGSVFGGGFCNGRLSDWEKNYRGDAKYYDAFNHLHKWHIRGDKKTLLELHEFHDRVFEVARGLIDVRDIFKFAQGLDARGEVLRHPGYRHPHEKDFDHTEVRYGGRMLHLFCEFSEECRQAGISSEAPVLVLAPMAVSAPQPESPFVLDGTIGFAFHDWGRPFEIEIEDGVPGPNLVAWWNEFVDPYLAQSKNHWIAPRLVARETYGGLIEYLRG